MSCLPVKGRNYRCVQCLEYKTVDSILGMWKVTCKHCRYTAVRTTKKGVESRANLHMLTKRHSVLIYHEDDPEETLEIIQPSNSPQMALGDDPPF